jgi:hypothetical protein
MTHWPAHNLDEVVSFLRTQHPGEKGMVRAVSERLGVSPPTVSVVFQRDDANLSWVEQVAEAYGFRLRLSFPAITHNGAVLQDRVADAVYPDAGNLAGLAEYAKQLNQTINRFSQVVGVNYRIIERAFKKGDIKISALKHIERKLGIKVTWEWVQISNP